MPREGCSSASMRTQHSSFPGQHGTEGTAERRDAQERPLDPSYMTICEMGHYFCIYQ